MLQTLLKDWRDHPQLAPLLLLLLAVPAAFFTTTASMVNVWVSNETFTHGFLILPISLWLIWGQRAKIAAIDMRFDARALLLLIPTLLLWLLASVIDVAVVQQLTMVALIPLSVWLFLGLELTLALLFPLLYLFFAVPLGQALIPPMMEFTADVTVSLVQHSGIPIYRDGLSFELPTGRWSVVEECSGVRYLIASAALGTIYAYITYRSLTKRTLFIIAALIVPIVANGLRAYGIVMIGHFSGMKYAVGADHLLYGWVFFGLVIFLLFWIGGLWADSPLRQEDRDGPVAEKDPSSSAGPTTAAPATSAPINPVLIAIALVALLLLNWGAARYQAGQNQALADTVVLSLPVAGGALAQLPATARTGPVWTPILSNPDLEASAVYGHRGTVVTLNVGYFHRQRSGSEAVSSLNRLSDPYGGDWKLTAQRSHRLPEGSVTESELYFGQKKVLVWSTYLIDGRVVANPYIAKLLQAKQLLWGRREAAFVTLAVPFTAPIDELQQSLELAWEALIPEVQSQVRELGKL